VAVPANVAGIAAVAVSAGAADSAVVSAGAADSAAVSAGSADSAVETVMAPPLQGVQKTPHWVGKRLPGPFRGGAAIEGVEAKGC
jgi:hypothetical protein